MLRNPIRRSTTHIVLAGAAVAALVLGACTKADPQIQSATSPPTEVGNYDAKVDDYMPEMVDGRPVVRAKMLAGAFTSAIGDVDDMALGEIQVAPDHDPATVPAAFIAVVDSRRNVEGIQHTLLAATQGTGESPIHQQEIAGVPVDVYETTLSGRGKPMKLVMEFFVAGDHLLVMVMSSEGKDLADALMREAIGAGATP